MSVYVDQVTKYPLGAIKDSQTRRNGEYWCHLFADTVEELHELAQHIGLRREWFQDRKDFPHYDIVPNKRRQAIKLGAVQTTTREWILRREHERSA